MSFEKRPMSFADESLHEISLLCLMIFTMRLLRAEAACLFPAAVLYDGSISRVIVPPIFFTGAVQESTQAHASPTPSRRAGGIAAR